MFQRDYNDERLRERLDQQTPSWHYVRSARPYAERLPPLKYAAHFLVKKINPAGTFRFQDILYIANVLVD